VSPGFEVKVDALSHVSMMMLETNDHGVVGVIGHSVSHGETGLRLTDPVTVIVNFLGLSRSYPRSIWGDFRHLTNL